MGLFAGRERLPDPWAKVAVINEADSGPKRIIPLPAICGINDGQAPQLTDSVRSGITQ